MLTEEKLKSIENIIDLSKEKANLLVMIGPSGVGKVNQWKF